MTSFSIIVSGSEITDLVVCVSTCASMLSKEDKEQSDRLYRLANRLIDCSGGLE